MDSPSGSDGISDSLDDATHQTPSGGPLDGDQFVLEIIEEAGDGPTANHPDPTDNASPPDLPEFLRKPWMPALAPIDPQASGYHPEKVYGFNRRFSLATVMLMMAGASVLLAVMNVFNVSPFVSGTMIVLCFATALGQMFLFGGRDPRRASIVVGTLFCTVGPLLSAIFLGVRVFGSRYFVTELLIVLLLGVPLGAMAGYVAGCVVAGVLLMMEFTESKLERRRKRRQPDDDPWPPPKSSEKNSPHQEQPQ